MNARTKNAVITLALGLALNIALGVSKLVVGIVWRSTSATSDALNNISDAAVSVVTILATAFSARHADHDHPFGHGRYEYIASFVVGAAVLAVGVEVLASGIRRAVDPVDSEYGAALFITLGAAIAVKTFMAAFYGVRGKRLGADTLKAACIDSISDAAVTAVVLCCAIVERYTGAHIDGYASMAVAVVIVALAVKMLKSTVSRLLGERPDPELYETVRGILLSAPEVLSVHDLIINDYGASNKIAEADAVFSADMSFPAVHAVCDALEREVLQKTGIRLSVHADPLLADDRAHDISSRVDEILLSYGATAHDISVDDEVRRVELDIVFGADVPESEIVEQVKAGIHAVLPEYAVAVNVDYI